MKRFLPAAVCTFLLSACATGTAPKGPEPVPPELVPAGFTAADCKVVKAAEVVTSDGPGDFKMAVGTRTPQVECSKATQGAVTVKSTPTCRTTSGKELPLADCCMTETGDPIPACTLKLQPPGK